MRLCELDDCKKPIPSARWCDDCQEKVELLNGKYIESSILKRIKRYNEDLKKKKEQTPVTVNVTFPEHDLEQLKRLGESMTRDAQWSQLRALTDQAVKASLSPEKLEKIQAQIDKQAIEEKPLDVFDPSPQNTVTQGPAFVQVNTPIQAGQAVTESMMALPETCRLCDTFRHDSSANFCWSHSVEFVEAPEQTPDNFIARKKSEASKTQQQEATMADMYSTQALVEDGVEAGYRLAGKQFTKLTKEPFIAAIAKSIDKSDDSLRSKLAAFFDTDLGEAFFQSMLSLGLSALPKNLGQQPELLARELRVQAMTTVGDEVADLLMGPMRQVITTYLSTPSVTTPALDVQSTSVVKVEIPVGVTAEAKR